MRIRFFLIASTLLLLVLPVLAQETPPQEIDPHNGPVTVEPQVQEDVRSVPIDEDTGTVDWENMPPLPPGPGSNFGFLITLYPPEPAMLADLPNNLLDSAWFPTIPFAYGYEPNPDAAISVQGWWFLEDSTGSLARRDMNITMDRNTWFCSTWFLGGSNVFHIEEGWASGYFAEMSYLPDEWNTGGIDYFLSNVWFKGVLGGQKMQDLLNQCNAQHIGRDLVRGGHRRLAIYQILPNEMDRQNGRANLLVWVTIGDWKLTRTRLHAAYATEVTEFRNVSPEIQNDTQVYYSDYLTPEIYWSINNYLLTHEGPFWGAGTEAGPTDPSAAGLVPVDQGSGDTSDGTGNTDGDSGDSGN
jgi:hypothetical protein